MGEIKYTVLSGKELTVSDDFRCFGMDALWKAFVNEKNPRIKQALDEAHSIMSGVLYGTITKDKYPKKDEEDITEKIKNLTDVVETELQAVKTISFLLDKNLPGWRTSYNFLKIWSDLETALNNLNGRDPEEDHTDDICPCGDVDCSRPFGHA